ncbi:MAG: class I SAM-dependent methyltransferase [Rhodothermales bacterium]
MSRSEDAPDARLTAPYSVLAVGYDVVMSHVDYELWAEYVQKLLDEHAPAAETVLELGCGTGSFAIELLSRHPYRYLATDASEMMIKVARRKAEELEEVDLRFDLADFTNFRVDTRVDAILLLYDGLNYLLETDDIRRLFTCTYRALQPGGVFVVDQSTPSNSVNNERFFEDSNEVEDFSYVRCSRYDAETHLHRTELDITVGERRFTERHVQRAYSLEEIRALIDEVEFTVEACYDGFSMDAATEASERAHWVLRRPDEATS